MKKAPRKPAIRQPGQHQHRLFVDRSAPGYVWACVCGNRFLQMPRVSAVQVAANQEAHEHLQRTFQVGEGEPS